MKYVRTSPRKMRRVIDLIRGQHVVEARRILRFSPLGPTHEVEKLLNSAIANAEQKPGVIARQPGGGARLGRRGPDAAPLPAARLRPRHAGPQAHLARDARRGDDGRGSLVGHKVNPYGFRLGVIYPWKSNWYAGRATTPTSCTRTSGSASTSAPACPAPASPRSTSSARATRSGCSSARPVPAS